jgi:MFS family permease
MYGRLPLYTACNILFVIFSIACAVASSLNQLIAFRFLMGCAGVAPLTIGAGTIADIMPVEKRGRAMAIYAMGPLIGPVIGPVGGGYMIQAIGWRWVFWLLAIVVSRFFAPHPAALVLLLTTRSLVWSRDYTLLLCDA